MDKPIAWMYTTEVCNRLEETEFSKDSGERRWREKVLNITPLYAEPELKDYWWLVDEWGCMNFFDSAEAYRYARQHVGGLMEGDCDSGDQFRANNIEDCWKMEDLLKWKNGVMIDPEVYK